MTLAGPLGPRLSPLCLLLVTVGAGTEGLQQWTQQPPYTEGNPGEAVTLPCIIHNIQVKLAWI